MAYTDVNSAHISTVTQQIYDQHLQQHFGEIQPSSKLVSYVLFKNSFLFEHYLNVFQIQSTDRHYVN